MKLWDARDWADVEDSGIRNWSGEKKSFQGRIWFILSLAELKIFSVAGDEFAIDDNIKDGEMAAGMKFEGICGCGGGCCCGWSFSVTVVGKLFKKLLGDSVKYSN